MWIQDSIILFMLYTIPDTSRLVHYVDSFSLCQYKYCDLGSLWLWVHRSYVSLCYWLFTQNPNQKSLVSTLLPKSFSDNQPGEPFRHLEKHSDIQSLRRNLFWVSCQNPEVREKMGTAGKTINFPPASYDKSFRCSAEHCNSAYRNYNRPPLLLGRMVHWLYLSTA